MWDTGCSSLPRLRSQTYCPACDNGKHPYPTLDARSTFSIREIRAGKDQRWKEEENENLFLNAVTGQIATITFTCF